MFQLIYTAIRTLAIGHALKKAGADPIQQAADIVDSAKEDPGGFIVDVFDGIRKLIILAVCLFIGFLLLVQGIQSLDEHLHGTDQPSPAPMIIVAVILVGTCVVLFVYSSTAPHSPARTVRQDEKTPEDYDVLGLECLLCRNYETAVKWFHLAAERGLARSQLNLGNRYALGQGVKQDYVEAVKWIRLAAEQGHPIAQLNLGRLYYEGNGVQQDRKRAWELLQTSAESGLADAQYCLGRNYADPEPGAWERDDVRAYMWLILASRQGHAEADAFRQEIGAKLTAKQISEAFKCADRWKPRPTMDYFPRRSDQ